MSEVYQQWPRQEKTIKDIEFPIILSEGLGLIRPLVTWTGKKVPRVMWTNEEIKSKLGLRSAVQILREGNTGYLNPCLDLTLATGAALQFNGVKHNWAIEEHGPTEDFKFNRLHFALEVEDTSGRYSINFRNGNTVQLSIGEYKGRPDIPQVQLLKINGSEINYELSFFKNFGCDTADEACVKLFKAYKLAPQITRLQQDNTPENYAKYQEVCGNKLKIVNIKAS